MYYLKLLLIGSWAICCTLVALIRCLVQFRNPEILHDFTVWLSWLAEPIAGTKIEVRGAEHCIEEPCVYIANHQSAFDAVLFGKVPMKRTVVVAKKEVARIPLIGWMFVATGSILIDRKSREQSIIALAKAARIMKRNDLSVALFPEGTRNTSEQPLLPFKKGAFYLAIEAQAPIVPMIATRVTRAVDGKRRVFPGGKMIVKVLPPVETKGLKVADSRELSDRLYALLTAEFIALEKELES